MSRVVLVLLLLPLVAPLSLSTLPPAAGFGASSAVVNQHAVQGYPHPGFEVGSRDAAGQAGSSVGTDQTFLENVGSGEDSTFQTPPSHVVDVKSLALQSDSSLFAVRGDLLPVGDSPLSLADAAPDGGKPLVSLSSPENTPALSAVTGFNGLIYGTDGSFINHFYPPDVQMAVGPSHVMELVNAVGGIWTKQGTSLSVFLLASFFGLNTADRVGDPKLLYDSSSSRWFASTDDFTTGAFTVGVSQTNDPTGKWTFWTITASSGYCPDQPILGVNDDKVAISANDYASCSNLAGTNYIGVEYWIINKSQMLAGGYIYWSHHSPDNKLFSLHPVQSLSSTTTLYMVSVQSSSTVRLWSETGVPTSSAGTSYVYSDIVIATASDPPSAPQKGTTYLLDSGDTRVQDALWSQGMLWFTFNDRCTPSGDTQTRSCVRVTQLDTSSKAVKQDSDLATVGQYYFYGALRLDSQGDAVIVVGYSSASDYPGILVLSQASGSSPNSYSTPSVLQAGSGPEAISATACTGGVCRYGDYFAASTDLSSPSVVWVAGEYGTPSGWATRISSVSLNVVSLTISFQIQGAGSGYSAPVLTYVLGGQQATAVLRTTPTSYSVDSGSSWAVTNPLSGSSSGERWQTNQPTNGTATSSQTISLVYFHQFFIAFGYNVLGGGTGYSAPSVTLTQFGSSSSVNAGVTAWTDSGSAYSYQTQLAGSSSVERWFTSSPTGTISSAAAISPPYYHQYLVSVAYSVIGGGSPSPPTLSVTALGLTSTRSVGTSPQGVWADSGTYYSVSNLLPESTSTERWATNTASSGTVSSAIALSLNFYHQYAITASYSIAGGGAPYPPAISYTSFAAQSTLSLATTPNVAWADSGSTFSTVGTLTSSTATERWTTTQPTSGSVTSPLTQTLLYYHQYLLNPSYSIVGSGTPAPPTLSYSSLGGSLSLQLAKTTQSIWADAGTRYTTTNPLSGSTSTERWYSPASNGTITAAGALSLSYNHQYLLTLVAKTTSSAFFNEGLQFTFPLPAISRLPNGTGLRISALTVDNGTPQMAPLTKGNLTISVLVNSAHTYVFTIVSQYQVAIDATVSAALKSITSPTIPGDNYWYDSGSQVTLALNGVFGRASGTGSRLASYSVNGGSPVAVSTTGLVNALSLTSISVPQSVTGTPVTQYQLSTPTGSVASTTAPTLTGDTGWYDSGTAVAVSYDHVWNVVPQQSRFAATGYSIDGGAATSVARAGTGTFNVALTMSSAHTVDVKYITQYFVSFQFTDAAGKRTIVPSALQIMAGGQTQAVPGFTTWLDSGASFTVSSLTYEGLDVKPPTPQQYSVNTPTAIALKASVYDATIKVADFLGLAVSGAQVKMTLANGTIMLGSTSTDGTFFAPAIPLGIFTASVSGIGSSTQMTGDASKQSLIPVQVLFSTTSLGIVATLILVVVLVAVLAVRRAYAGARRKAAAMPEETQEPPALICPNCGATIDTSDPFCPNCGSKLTQS